MCQAGCPVRASTAERRGSALGPVHSGSCTLWGLRVCPEGHRPHAPGRLSLSAERPSHHGLHSSCALLLQATGKAPPGHFHSCCALLPQAKPRQDRYGRLFHGRLLRMTADKLVQGSAVAAAALLEGSSLAAAPLLKGGSAAAQSLIRGGEWVRWDVAGQGNGRECVCAPAAAQCRCCAEMLSHCVHRAYALLRYCAKQKPHARPGISLP